MAKKRRILNCKGVTLTEMVVSFALLAIFLVAVSVVITYAVKNYYNERRVMTSYSVADLVLDAVKNDIQTMQASKVTINGLDYGEGYVKLRDETGHAIQVHDNHTVKGSTIEFVSSNIKDAVYAEQIDTKGYKGFMIRNKSVTQSESTINPLAKDKLTVRYYSKDTGEAVGSKYHDLYIDKAFADAKVSTDIPALTAGADVVRDCEEKLSKEMYDTFTVSVSFATTPVKVGSDFVIKSVVCEVTVYEDGDVKYIKEREIPLQNRVIYNNDATMYSEA